MQESSHRSIRRGSLRIEAMTVPPLGNNVFIVFEDGTAEAIVIDTAQGSNQILQRLKQLELKPTMIINTHGHTDHTAEDDLLRKETGAKLAIHELDAYRLATEDEASGQLGLTKRPIEADEQLVDGQEIKVGENCILRVMHTPGHTEGSICLYDEKDGQLFSGDTLFAGGYGRLDGAGAQPELMTESLGKLMRLPESTEVYPGHGSFTTIEAEKEWVSSMLDGS